MWTIISRPFWHTLKTKVSVIKTDNVDYMNKYFLRYSQRKCVSNKLLLKNKIFTGRVRKWTLVIKTGHVDYINKYSLDTLKANVSV